MNRQDASLLPQQNKVDLLDVDLMFFFSFFLFSQQKQKQKQKQKGKWSSACVGSPSRLRCLYVCPSAAHRI